MQRSFSDQEIIRRKKLRDLQDQGQNPFVIDRVDRTHTSAQFKAAFGHLDRAHLDANETVCTLAGRIMAQRQMFAVIQDQFGRTQLFFPKVALAAERLAAWKDLDIGDIIAATGTPMKTNTGELTLKISDFTLLSKSLRVLPEKYHGLVDVEERARRRYVDLIMSDESRNRFLTRSMIIQKIREYMAGLGYLEVETPILQDVLGGAAAKPFVTHHNALDRDYYLRIATELHLKRCIVGGMDKVFELGRVFRNEGMDATHNPEFTTLEAYAAYHDINDMMLLAEGMFRFLAKELDIGAITTEAGAIDLHAEFRRVHMADLIKERCGVDFWAIKTLDEAERVAREHGIHLHKHQHSFGHIVNLFFEHFGEKSCVQPTFVYGHPVEISPLAKVSVKDPRFTERFELFIAGKEYANAFGELNDPIDQYERFEQQLHLKDLGDEEANEMDIDFVEALEYGMPPSGGIGIGIDRLVMLLTNTPTIRDVLLFPHMRKRQGE